MSEERKPLWPWIVALLIGLPVLYVASFGPACLIWGQRICDSPALLTVYLPCIRAVESGPAPVQSALWQWASCCQAGSKLDEILRRRRPRSQMEIDIEEYRRWVLEVDAERRQTGQQ